MIQQTSAETLVNEGLLRFVNLHPMGEADETKFELALNLLKWYLQVVRQLVVFSMGQQVCSSILASDSFGFTC